MGRKYEHMEKHSTSLVITDMQITTTVRYHYTSICLKLKILIISSFDKDVEELKPPQSTDWEWKKNGTNILIHSLAIF